MNKYIRRAMEIKLGHIDEPEGKKLDRFVGKLQKAHNRDYKKKVKRWVRKSSTKITRETIIGVDYSKPVGLLKGEKWGVMYGNQRINSYIENKKGER